MSVERRQFGSQNPRRGKEENHEPTTYPALFWRLVSSWPFTLRAVVLCVVPMTLVLGTVVVLAIFAGGVLVKAVVPVIGGVLASTWLCAHARRRAARSERCQHDDEPETGSQQ